jgi:hypothetical protein
VATVASAALVGCTTLALAQGAPKVGQTGAGGMSHGQSLEQQNKGAVGGALKGEGNSPVNPGGKTLGQSGKEPKTLRQSGAQPNNGADRGAQQLGQGRPAQDQEKANPQRGAGEEHGKAGVNTTEQHTGQATSHGQGSSRASVQLSQVQRSKIWAAIGKGHAAHAADVKFSVTVGAMVPRSVHVEVLPENIVEIVPQYEGFDYIVVGDQILIVDPDTMEIVAIVPA